MISAGYGPQRNQAAGYRGLRALGHGGVKHKTSDHGGVKHKTSGHGGVKHKTSGYGGVKHKTPGRRLSLMARGGFTVPCRALVCHRLDGTQSVKEAVSIDMLVRDDGWCSRTRACKPEKQNVSRLD